MKEIKIFTLDDEDYYAAHSLMEFLNWYNENIEPLETAGSVKRRTAPGNREGASPRKSENGNAPRELKNSSYIL